MKRVLGGIAALCLVGGVAYAQQAPEKVAQDEFNKGNVAYNLGKWDEAVDHFTKAYEAWAQPEFLYNIAQAYRQADNCKQALYFYKRFRSLKENDKAAPLSARKKAEVERFIEQLTDCAAKADTTASSKPDSIDEPPAPPRAMTGTPTPPVSLAPPSHAITTTTVQAPRPATPPSPPLVKPTRTAALHRPEADEAEQGDSDSSVTAASTVGGRPRLVSLRAESGIATLSAGDLDVPVQPTFAVTGGYPLVVGPVELDLGAGVSYTPLPYQVMGAQKRGTMAGARAVIAAAYPIAGKLALRGEVGFGVVSLTGLEIGNPLVQDQSAKSFTLLSARLALAVDYAITPNIFATVSPLGVAYSPAAAGMYGGSLRELDVLAGIGYRQ